MSEPGKSDKKSPGFWFYPADYEKDVQILSLAAQGLWMRMLCWMSENEAHRGFLELPSGQPMTERDIAAKVGKPLREVRRYLNELERIGVFSRADYRAIYSRRMARDTHISEIRSEAAKSRMEKAKRAASGAFAGDFDPANDPAKDDQKPTVTASVSVSDSSLTNTGAKISTLPNPILEQVASEIHARHPPHRRCSLNVVRSKLKTILRKVPKSEWESKLRRINANHRGYCESADWQKNDGQYVNSLENWLAPTKGRFDNEPPSDHWQREPMILLKDVLPS